MEPKIVTSPQRKLVGRHLTTNFVQNRTPELWRNFMKDRHLLHNTIGSELYSIAIYDPTYFSNFKPSHNFEKWAAVEVPDDEGLPESMEPLLLPAGLYAVFVHKGPSTDTSTFHYIFSKWLPSSDYVLDDRPHFEVMGEKYKHDQPDSEEEIWIPIKKK